MTSVFISGLPYEATEDQIRDLFSDCGKIVNIKLPKYQDTGRLLGYGHVTFSNEGEATSALGKNNATLGTRYINVLPARGEKELKPKSGEVPEDCKTIFVKNLPFTITTTEIGDAFKHCGKIDNVRMVYNSASKLFKGFCYIDFRRRDSVISAMKMNGKDINGRKIFVDFETSQAKQGYKYPKEQIEANVYSKDIDQIKNKKIKKEKKKEKVETIKNYAKTRKEELAQKRRQEVQNFEQD